MKKIFVFIVGFFLITSLFAQQNISLKDVVGATFRTKSVSNVNWTLNGNYYSSQVGNQIVRFDVKTGTAVDTILKASQLPANFEFDDYSFSADENQILLLTEIESIYRRSFKANYFVFDRKTQKITSLSSNGKQSYATFSPDGTKIAFVRQNNLFFLNTKDFVETQITNDGKFNEIINGSTDWVYEEEFGFAQAFYWSPDSKKIAFFRFDEKNIKEYNMQMWSESSIYPIDYRFKYPKAGEENSKIGILVYDLDKNQTKNMNIGQETDIYIPRINWTKNANLLSIRRMNRLQNKLEILHADISTGETKIILSEESKTAFVNLEYTDNLTYLKDGKHFVHASERDGFKHLYLYELNGKLVRQLTQGNWEVAELLGIDESQKSPVFYFTSTEVSPLERHFYSLDWKGKKTKLSAEKGVHQINMSTDFQYYLDYHSNSESPLKVSLFQTKGNKTVKVMEDNAELRKKIQEFGLSKKEFFSFKNSENIELHGFMIKPKNFDETKKYPVLMYVYGGPGSQNVLNNFGGGHYYWHHYLAQQGYLIICVDNQGTDARGYAFKTSTYANLGKKETQDQIDAANYLKKMPFVDGERVGIWGWSYGGYMSSLCILLGNDVFKTAIAVAPVTNWRFYDSVYTERFLQRPQDNASGYDDYSPISHVDKLKGNYFLIHGTGDDNVHFQNAVMMENALISAGKQFRSFYYPNRNHGIYGGNTREHLYQMMTDFVKEKL